MIFFAGHYDPGYLMVPHPMPGGLGAPHIDSQRVLVHWNQNVGNQPQQNVGQTSNSGSKTDEEADDDGRF